MKRWLLLSVMLLAAFLGGMLFAANNRLEAGSSTVFINQAHDQPETVDFSDFWRAWKLIDEHFVATATSSDRASVGGQEKVWGAIQGLAESLNDPYSNFLPPEENKMFTEEISGNFGGVGMEIGKRDKVLTVVAPLPETPAKKAGLQAGDKILEIDGRSTADLSVTEAIKLIRGEVGTTVVLTIRRDEEEQTRTFKLARAVIKIPTIESENLPGGITHLSLFNFGATAPSAFRRAMGEFAQSGNRRLILDLRGNPGGYMESAISVASWFLPAGTPVVIEERSQGQEAKVYRSAGHALGVSDLKMVILVDGGSASASEIVAGALSEHGVATLVGEQTFGKGSVQELFPVGEGTALKLTIARWLTPKGISISENGLTPEIAVPGEEAAKAGEETADPQLAAAIKAVKSR